MQYRRFITRDDPDEGWRFSDEDGDGLTGDVAGETHGCGCCSEIETVTADDLEVHIKHLEKALEVAKSLRDKV